MQGRVPAVQGLVQACPKAQGLLELEAHTGRGSDGSRGALAPGEKAAAGPLARLSAKGAE